MNADGRRLRRGAAAPVLAVFCPAIGRPSETFIRRHVRDLLPGRTVVITEQVIADTGSGWAFDGPTLNLALVGRTLSDRVRLRLGLTTRTACRERAVRAFLRRHGVTVALLEWLDQGCQWVSPCRAEGVRVFAHAHGYDLCAAMLSPDREWRGKYQQYREADGVIVVSSPMRDRLLDIGLPAERIHLLPYGVDVAEDGGRRSEDGGRISDLGPRTSDLRTTIRCLAVGRMVPKKAPVLLLDAFRRAAERVPGLELVYIGGGPLLAAALDYVRAFGLSDRVEFRGECSHADVLEEMNRSDLFLQHSCVSAIDGDEEGLPIAILEAMGAGLPVVATRHAGIPDAVVDGETGFLVDEGDVAGMAERIVRLAASAEDRARMGAQTRERVRERFNAAGNLVRLRRILELREPVDSETLSLS